MNSSYKTPLYYALHNKHIEAARWLLEHGSIKFHMNMFIELDNVSAVELLLEFNYCIKDSDLLKLKSLEMAKLFVAWNVFFPRDGYIMIRFFEHLGTLPEEIIDFYIANGLTVRKMNEAQQSRVMCELPMRYIKKLADGFNKAPFALAAATCDIEKIKLFIDRGDDFDSYQRNALMNYLRFGYPHKIEIVEMLVEVCSVYNLDDVSLCSVYRRFELSRPDVFELIKQKTLD